MKLPLHHLDLTANTVAMTNVNVATSKTYLQSLMLSKKKSITNNVHKYTGHMTGHLTSKLTVIMMSS